MKLTELIKLAESKGIDRLALCDSAGITKENLAVKVNKGIEVLELADGRFVTVRRDAVYFDLGVSDE